MTPVTTPVEEYNGVLVKREDLCTRGTAAPPFSKMRGVIEHVRNRPEMTIGVLDTYHSQGGHAVAYACHVLGKQCVNFWPRRKSDVGEGLRPQQTAAQDLDAILVGLPAGRSSVLYHRAKTELQRITGDTYMMPNALKLHEMVTTTADEVMNTPEIASARTIVVSISSGTIAAGVWAGLHRARWTGALILHMGYSRSIDAVKRYVHSMAEAETGHELWHDGIQLRLVDEHFAYGDAVDTPVPFPSNKYYDAKTWRWLMANPIPETLLWNIG